MVLFVKINLSVFVGAAEKFVSYVSPKILCPYISILFVLFFFVHRGSLNILRVVTQ